MRAGVVRQGGEERKDLATAQRKFHALRVIPKRDPDRCENA